MIKWILQDTKRILKSHKAYILLIIVSLSMIAFVMSQQSKGALTFSVTSMDEDFMIVENEYDVSLESIFNLEIWFSADCPIYSLFEELPDNEACNNYRIYKSHLARYDKEMSDQEVYELNLFFYNKMSDQFLNYYENESDLVRGILDTYLLDIEEIFEIKDYVNEHLNPKFEDFDIPYYYVDVHEFNLYAIQLHENYTNMVNHYPQDIKYQMTSSFFVANYLNEYFLLLMVVGIVLVFDSFYRDYRTGVIKNILSSPIKRSKYILVKTISSLISLIVILIIPLLSVAIILYFINGYNAPAYPIYTSRSTMTSFTPERIYMKAIVSDEELLGVSTYKSVCTLEPVTKFATDIDIKNVLEQVSCHRLIPGAHLNMIPVGQYVLISMGYLLLIILFLSSLNTMLSLVFSNQIYNLMALSAFLVISNLLSKNLFGATILKALPFTFLSPTALMMQTIPYTFLNGVLTISLWTLIVTIFNIYLIKRKDFTY